MEDSDYIPRWLHHIGLPEYVDLFAYHQVREDILLLITDRDLCNIGISKLGHRKQIITSLNEMREKSPRFVKAYLIYGSNYTLFIYKFWLYQDLLEEILEIFPGKIVGLRFIFGGQILVVKDDVTLKRALSSFMFGFEIQIIG